MCYWYLHTNGEMIWKNALSVDYDGPEIYFEGGFVQKYWKIDEKNNEQILDMIDEAIKLGANLDSVERVLANMNLKRMKELKKHTAEWEYLDDNLKF